MTSNPYETPKSDIRVAEKYKRSIWWKIYFFVFTILSFTGTISILAADGAGIVDYVALLLEVVATVGLFGFVFLKRILWPKFWLVYLILYFVSGFFYEFLSGVDMRDGMSDNEYYISMAIGYLIAAPAYFALFLYSRENNPIWKNA